MPRSPGSAPGKAAALLTPAAAAASVVAVVASVGPAAVAETTEV